MRIQNYVLANEVDIRDKLLGTGYLTGHTQNYSVEDLIGAVLQQIADPNVNLSVQADWSVTDSSSATYIKNKPDIYTLPSGQFYRTKGIGPDGNANISSGLEVGDVIAGIWTSIERYTIARYDGGDVNNINNYAEMAGWPINY